jgi:hypothetical protein
MIKVGLIGEDPNDTDSIQNLLLQKLKGKASFVKLLKNKRGHQLNNNRTSESLKIEYRDKKPDLVVFIRDTDCLVTESQKINKTIKWFTDLSRGIAKPMLLLNIYELEALVIADIKTFNKVFGTSIANTKNVHYIKEPKEFLINKTSKGRRVYKESDCPDLFKLLDIDVVASNCTEFKKFLTKLLAHF